ncbi:hypothetical protein, partial [Lysinibacillus fusiformis]|uniref:hypothetical protein n=1 Tax=Lysinibacillus fusiformis TaxID=28031 RepID=UPI002E1F7D6B|nr:hypothetical protein [Lysinibacillus fusiformis]
LFRSLARLAIKNFIDYVLLVQFSRFISKSFFSDFFILTSRSKHVNHFFEKVFYVFHRVIRYVLATINIIQYQYVIRQLLF